MSSVIKNNHRFLYLLLLPLFFVLHGLTENYGLVTARDGGFLLLTYLLAGSIIFAVARKGFGQPAKAGLFTFFLFCIYFFFGSLYDFLKTHDIFIYKYRYLLPFLFILVIVVVTVISKATHDFRKFRQLLTWILVISISADLVRLAPLVLHPPADRLSVYGSNPPGSLPVCAACAKPDIYFLLFDEYGSTASLRKDLHFDNSALDSFLRQQHFFLQHRSSSNYNFTPFSMASMLNMDYLGQVGDSNHITVQDYAACNQLIRNNAVIRFLSAMSYDIVNFSIFDLEGHPALVSFSLLPVKTRLITAQTLFSRIERDLAWNLQAGPVSIPWLSRRKLMENLQLNDKFERGVRQAAEQRPGRPRFIYAHFEMPHRPYYFDKNLQRRPLASLQAEKSGNYPASYTGYLAYVNRHLEDLVMHIRRATRDSAVIIIMGDHGYRGTGIPGRTHYFSNLSAVYFPDHNYALLNDSSSAVNQFRMVFNAQFRQSFPLLKDSAVFLRDAGPAIDN